MILSRLPTAPAEALRQRLRHSHRRQPAERGIWGGSGGRSSQLMASGWGGGGGVMLMLPAVNIIITRPASLSNQQLPLTPPPRQPENKVEFRNRDGNIFESPPKYLLIFPAPFPTLTRCLHVRMSHLKGTFFLGFSLFPREGNPLALAVSGRVSLAYSGEAPTVAEPRPSSYPSVIIGHFPFQLITYFPRAIVLNSEEPPSASPFCLPHVLPPQMTETCMVGLRTT